MPRHKPCRINVVRLNAVDGVGGQRNNLNVVHPGQDAAAPGVTRSTEQPRNQITVSRPVKFNHGLDVNNIDAARGIVPVNRPVGLNGGLSNSYDAASAQSVGTENMAARRPVTLNREAGSSYNNSDNYARAITASKAVTLNRGGQNSYNTKNDAPKGITVNKPVVVAAATAMATAVTAAITTTITTTRTPPATTRSRTRPRSPCRQRGGRGWRGFRWRSGLRLHECLWLPGLSGTRPGSVGERRRLEPAWRADHQHE